MEAMPDFLLILDTVKPEQSVMLVLPPGERPQQYKVSLPPNQTSLHWVVALTRKEPEVWKRLPATP